MIIKELGGVSHHAFICIIACNNNTIFSGKERPLSELIIARHT